MFRQSAKVYEAVVGADNSMQHAPHRCISKHLLALDVRPSRSDEHTQVLSLCPSASCFATAQ